MTYSSNFTGFFIADINQHFDGNTTLFTNKFDMTGIFVI